jgi:hypothetical protein
MKRGLANLWLGGDCSAEPNCADFNGDLNVNFNDFALFSQEWRPSHCEAGKNRI